MKDKKIDVVEIREKLGITQSELAKLLSVHSRTIQNWEKGTKIPAVKHEILRNLLNNYSGSSPKVSSDSNSSITEVERIRKSKIFDSNQKGVIAVPIKAQANYSRHFDNVVFQNQLERIYIPNSPYDGNDFRYFQVEGDSMEYVDERTGMVSGISDGSWVIAERIPKEDWSENLRKFYVYVIVTDSRITIKRILQDNPHEIVLHADNEIYGQERISLDEINEIWMFKRKLDWNAPPPRRIDIKV